MKWLNNIPFDKREHIYLTLILLFSFNMLFQILIAYILAILVGLAKEYIWDKLLKMGTFSIADIKYNVASATIGVILITILNQIHKYIN